MKSITSVEERLSSSYFNRLGQELFRNTGQYPIVIILIEVLLIYQSGKWNNLFEKPDIFILLIAMLIQAAVLAYKEKLVWWQRFSGNLIAPTLYFASVYFFAKNSFLFEDAEVLSRPHHFVYWFFAIFLGLLQALQSGKQTWFSDFLLILENVMRAQILFVAYAIFESYSAKLQMSALNAFFADETHLLILLITFTLGFSTGVADVNSRNYLAVLRQTAGQLKIYSEWLLGRNLLGRAINDPNSMSLARRQRTVLFMDIRGFTRWSEQHSPEEVAMLLNGYYLTIENVMEKAEFIKYKFTADEVMGVFIDADKAVQAARELNAQIATYLQPYQLGAGIGINTGFLVEGLLGGKNIRFYDVIGDTVNTAHRIEGAANAGEIWISADARAQLADLSIQNEKEIALKGKELPAKVYLIQ